MTTDVAPRPPDAAALLERVVIGGDLSKLTPTERLQYYREVCASIGLNPLTKPFEYLHLNGKLILYARRDATDQLRKLHGVSITIVAREQREDVYVVLARAIWPGSGRTDESIGAVATGGLKGDALANALMKAETKAKRRVTLSLCGLGMLDETEVETIPAAALEIEPESGRQELPPPTPTGEFEQFKLAFRRFATTDDDPAALAALWRGMLLPENWRLLTVSQQVELGAEHNAARKRLGVR